MIRLLLFATLGYLAVRLPIVVFAYTPWLRDCVHRVPLLVCTMALLSGGVVLFALTH